MSVSVYTHSAAIMARYKTLVEDGESLPTQYPNAPSGHLTKPNGLWAQVMIRYGKSRQSSVGAPGSNRFDTPGVFFVQLFDLLEEGEKRILEKAAAVANHFRSVTVGSIVYWTPSVIIVGRDGNQGRWWQVNVECPFRASATES